MTPEQFKEWRKAQRMTQPEAAEALGISRAMVSVYEKGARYDTGEPVSIPKAVVWACAAIQAGVTLPEGW